MLIPGLYDTERDGSLPGAFPLESPESPEEARVS
jgi:hypothetical protein